MSITGEIEERARDLERRAGVAKLPDLEARAVKIPELAKNCGKPWRGDYWSAAKVEEAWDALHELEHELLKKGTDPEVAVVIPRLLSRLEELPARDPRRKNLTAVLKPIFAQWKRDSSLARKADVLEIFDETYAAASDVHKNLHALRNLLLGSAITLALAATALAVVQYLEPTWISFCHESVCLAGTAPAKGDVLQIALIGAAGGLIGAVAPLTSVRRISTRYNVRLPQLMLKPALGAVTAILGVILVQARILPLDPTSDQLLAYGVLFGASQQLFTRLVDMNVDAILTAGGASSAKADGDADQPADDTTT